MNTIVILFSVIFLLNIIPAFAPPTWMVFSFIGFRFPDHMNWTFALVGAFAATAAGWCWENCPVGLGAIIGLVRVEEKMSTR